MIYVKENKRRILSDVIIDGQPFDAFDDRYEFSYRLRGFISFGNMKLPEDTVIFNMTSGTDCSSKKLGLCPVINAGAKCYAIKAEVMYPSVLPYRRRQEKFWDNVSPERFSQAVLDINASKRKKIRKIRFSEAGDFRDQSDVAKMVKISNILQQHGIRSYVYTARQDLNFKNVGALNVNGSGFMVVNEYRAVPYLPEKLNENERICPCKCRKCSLCVFAKNKTILVEFH